MKTSYVVIGANFGDEAKGKIVDALVAKAQTDGKFPIVCRFNGGGQAGHTVIVGAKRHVFSHVASNISPCRLIVCKIAIRDGGFLA